MPRPAGISYFALFILLTLPVIRLTAENTAASQTPPSGGVSRQGFGGTWVLDLDRGDLPVAPSGLDGRGRGGRGRPGGAGLPMDPKTVEEEMARRQALANWVTAATIATKRLSFVIGDSAVTITDADGRVQNLPTDNKKIDGRAGNGLIKLFTRNHWDGNTLICEAEVDLGPRVVHTFALSPGGTELRVTTTVQGQGEPVNLLRFYERPFDAP